MALVGYFQQLSDGKTIDELVKSPSDGFVKRLQARRANPFLDKKDAG